MGCHGLHCDGCSRGSGGTALVIVGSVLALGVIGSSAAVADAVTALVIVITCVIVLAVLGLLGFLVYRIHRELTPDAGPGIARTRVRAEVIGVRPAGDPLRVPERDASALPASMDYKPCYTPASVIASRTLD